MKIGILIIAIALVIISGMYLLSRNDSHNATMQREHAQLHLENEAIMRKAIENGLKLDILLNIATNRPDNLPLH